MKPVSPSLTRYEGNPAVTGAFPLQIEICDNYCEFEIIKTCLAFWLALCLLMG